MLTCYAPKHAYYSLTEYPIILARPLRVVNELYVESFETIPPDLLRIVATCGIL